jgi:hypothetical protein
MSFSQENEGREGSTVQMRSESRGGLQAPQGPGHSLNLHIKAPCSALHRTELLCATLFSVCCGDRGR